VRRLIVLIALTALLLVMAATPALATVVNIR